MIQVSLTILIAYLLGAVPFGLLIARTYGVPDLRNVGSGNIGATNVYRAAGLRASLWVYILDVSKGALAVFIATRIANDVIGHELFLVLVAIATVLGHVFPVYLGFRGGKGVATALGCLLVIMPVETLIALAAFLVIVLPTRLISLGSIVAALVLPIVLLIERFAMSYAVSDVYLILALVMSLIVMLTHTGNIKRLLTGQEQRIGPESSKEKANSHA